MAGTEEISSMAAPRHTSVADALKAGYSRLQLEGIENPALDAEVLLSFCINQPRSKLYVYPELPVSGRELECFESLLERRAKGEPVAYLTGEKEFWSLPFRVDRRVLIPRPETEVLVEEALKLASEYGGTLSILEIGTGSGAISVALARELPASEIVATDVSLAAVEVARHNAEVNGVAGKIEFRTGDLLSPVAGMRFNLIISNPPYISEDEFAQLSLDIRDFEPKRALVPGPDGTECHERIIRQGKGFLKPAGAVILEIGAFQHKKIEEIFRKEGYNRIAFRKDYAGLCRAAVARTA